MVSISVEELVKWDKRSKDLTNQVKSLQTETERVKMELDRKDRDLATLLKSRTELDQKDKDLLNQLKGLQNENLRIRSELE